MASSSSSLIASQSLLTIPNPNPNPYIPKSSIFSLNPNLHHLRQPLLLSLTTPKQRTPNRNGVILLSAASQTPTRSPLTGSTRTLTTLFALTLAAFRKLSVSINSLPQSLGPAAGPLFFAALRDRPSGYLNTPLTVVAAGLSKWLDIYSGVLMVRVLLSWFPNIPWDRQPLSAIRDLCDPYLNLFRNIIPPVFDTLDVSPLLAFAVLGTLGSILNNSRAMY
ncbi:hypothetical protein UlMin_041846 [Ulmus minor]